MSPQLTLSAAVCAFIMALCVLVAGSGGFAPDIAAPGPGLLTPMPGLSASR